MCLGCKTYTAVGTHGQRLCAVQAAGVDGVLDNRIAYYRSGEACVEVGGVGEIDIIASKLVLEPEAQFSGEVTR